MSQQTRLHVLPQTKELLALFTYIRDKHTHRKDFIYYSDRIIRLLVEYGIDLLPMSDKTVTSPTGATFSGYEFSEKLCGVSILRAGEAMEPSLRDCCRDIRIGKILIQRDEKTAEAHLYYSKMPPDISKRFVLLLDPMLATGGSAIKAIEVLTSKYQVPEHRILFLNVIAAPEGIEAVNNAFPEVKIVTATIDDGLNDQFYIVPGLGDFGCRYFGTEETHQG